ncbi:ABC transporter permease [Rubrivirga litoralis]|uniref:FtsX-like permease family protein n=1 Tax=Rubrivirga litoralis TaxID=3075598 RepID=A0ABU3BP78_9BACT|nr:FtsX-like permease family protein [Rubrivirga sp. F394]MDT0631091.1 FtsX-like permease family protein [Rubrivirga sp. F394]
MALSPFRFAWQDSRGMRRRLVLYVSAMALGVAALVAIRSFGINLERAVAEQSKEVFGSDLEVRRSAAFPDSTAALLDSLEAETGATVVREVSFPSMARFPASAGGEGRARLAQVRALDGPYPLYGEVQTTPAAAAERIGRGGGALVDATLLLQMDAAVGDSVQVGGRAYPIVGRVDGVPGQAEIASLVGPRVYLPLAEVDSTLLGFGSRARYAVGFRFPDAEAATPGVASRLDDYEVRYETAGEEQQEITEASGYLTRFLSLVGFVALLLGGIGVASSVSVYVGEKAETVATLRCLGVSSGRVLAVYALQALALGLVGAVLGATLGVGVQRLLPLVLQGFLPVDVQNDVVPRALVEGLGVGLVTALLFALLPLVGVRRVPPLRALRADARAGGVDPLRWLLVALLVAAVGGFAYLQTQSWGGAAAFVGGTAAVFALLALAAVAVRGVLRRVVRPGLPYAWRQGLANLYTPGNQTLVLLLTMGLGVFLVLALALVQRSILEQVAVPTGDDRSPDVILFDVQPSQRDSLRALVESQGLPVIQEVPLVQMRIAAVDGVPVDTLLETADDSFAGTEGGPERWTLTREYRSTYRTHTVPTETVVAGAFEGTAPEDADVVPVSIEAELAADLDVGVGSRITWSVGGADVESVVTSLRDVDWAQVQPNFFAVFAAGPLDAAPQTAIVLTRAGSPERSARVQSAAVEAFPNVSAVDVQLVLSLIDRVLARVAFVLRFMALFAVATGLVVLAGAVRVALGQRTREVVMLRTLGASRAQVRRILVAEYALLGVLAALTGGVLALAGAWGLAAFVFEIPFRPDLTWLGWALVVVPLLTVAVGLLGSRGALRQPPLAVLRSE